MPEERFGYYSFRTKFPVKRYEMFGLVETLDPLSFGVWTLE